MRVNFSNQNVLFNVTAINQKVNKTKREDRQSETPMMFGRRDFASISRQGKKESLVQQLQNQKKLILENKDALLKNGMENGQGVDQSKLDEYEKQLKMLDEKIAQAMAEDAKPETEDSEDNKNKAMAEKEYQNQKMAAMVSLSSDAEHSEAILSVKGKMDGEARVLKAEIKSDGPRALSSKFERTAEIESKTAELLEQAGAKSSTVMEHIEENNSIDIIDAKEKEDLDKFYKGMWV